MYITQTYYGQITQVYLRSDIIYIYKTKATISFSLSLS